MSSSAGDLSDYSVNITESWRSQVGAPEGGDDVASDGVVLSNGDLVLAGSHGPAGSVPDSAFDTQRRGGSDGNNSSGSSFVAYRIDGSTGQAVWQWEGTTGPTSGDFLFAAGIASGSTGGPSSTGDTGGQEESVVLGGSTEGDWSNASSSSSSSSSSPGEPQGSSSVVNGNAQIAAVKLDASTGEEIWRFQQVPDDVGGGGGEGPPLPWGAFSALPATLKETFSWPGSSSGG